MADPATIAMAAKAAVAVATDKNVWKVIGSIVAGVAFVILLPLLLIMSIFSGGAEQNRDVTDIVFNGGVIPSSYSAEYREYIIKMQEAFAAIDTKIFEKNQMLGGDSSDAEASSGGTPRPALDGIRIKAVFYSLYFGTDFSSLDDGFYSSFVDAFTETVTDNGTEKVMAIKELDKAYNNLASIIGRVITDNEKANINNLYFQIKYGYIVNGADPGIPGEAFDDENFAALMAEATKYIGYPYVWGGSTPSESFDCSGFICWSYTKSGVYNLPRTTAQGVFNQCTIVSKDEVKPGDLVFFTKTYDSVNPVTHIAIYVGNGKILHAGDPIGYADLSDSYYKKHFYAYGRLRQ